MRRCMNRLIGDRGGAIAPTLALSLFALIAAGGIAFDYARMASLDTELQNAADQAALAAASQLDGNEGACERAVAAARNMIANRTLMANEAGAGRAITIADPGVCGGDTSITFNANASIRFYQEKDKDPAATDDSNAKFVEVEVDPREAFFAFTPIVAAFSSGQLTARAFAGLGEAICRVPPLMMCNPDETNDPSFTIEDYIGIGVRLVANDGGGNYGPGNFGFLDVGQGANDLAAILGRNGDPGNCSSGTTVTTEPGNMINLRDALNTRFDMYDQGLNQACSKDGTMCPPSYNARIDLVRDGTGNNSCGFSQNGSQGWSEPANVYPGTAYPEGSAPVTLSESEIAAVSPMGYPRDICHAFSIVGACTRGIIGSGLWDRYAYFRSHSLTTPANYSVDSTSFNGFLMNTFGTTTPTRFQVYQYEMANAATRLQPVAVGSRTSSATPVCNQPGVQPGPNQIDRRVLSVAVVNCVAEGIKGKTSGVEVTKHIDVFLTEPTVPRERTEIADIYVEIVGESANAADGNNIQTVKKAVPYLIE